MEIDDDGGGGEREREREAVSSDADRHEEWGGVVAVHCAVHHSLEDMLSLFLGSAGDSLLLL